MAEPRMRARMLSPSAWASDQRFSTKRPQPSPRTYPSAEASKVLQRPSEASMRDFEKLILISGERIRLTPPASASPHSPARKLWQARWTATSEPEQAVSSAILGPWNPSVYEILPDATLKALPAPV